MPVEVSTAGKGFGAFKLITKPTCPCGSGRPYKECCQPYHQSTTTKPPSAEALLRARFSAYVKRYHKFIVRTTHPTNTACQGSVSADGKIHTTLEQDVKVTMEWIEFRALAIMSVVAGASEDEVTIEYQVKLRKLYELPTGRKIKDAPVETAKETAHFKREDGEWFVVGTTSNWDRDRLQLVEGSS